MSKLLKKGERLEEVNSAHIAQIAASIPTSYYTQAEVDALLPTEMVGQTMYEHVAFFPNTTASIPPGGGFLILDGDADEYLRTYFQCHAHVNTASDVIFHLLHAPQDTDAAVNMQRYAGAAAPTEAFSFNNIENGTLFNDNWTNGNLQDYQYTFGNADINANDALTLGWRVLENARETRFVCIVVEYIWK